MPCQLRVMRLVGILLVAEGMSATAEAKDARTRRVVLSTNIFVFLELRIIRKAPDRRMRWKNPILPK